MINESLVAFHKVLKRNPKLFSDLKSVLLLGKPYINTPEATKSFIWIVGTFCQQIDAAPYILEEYIESEDDFMGLSDSVKEVLLTQIVQTFLKRPPEMHRTLATIFKYLFNNDTTSMMLKDHACFYYRALKDSPE